MDFKRESLGCDSGLELAHEQCQIKSISMTIDPETVERYQIEYQKNPKSRIFAPLAEAYRQMGMLEEALQICAKGVETHPDFPGGHVALAKILIDLGKKEEALTQLKTGASLSADNILAHSLMADLFLEMRRPKEALKAYKTVLFLNPHDEKAGRMVRKWEFLSAEDYSDELFEMKPVFQAAPPEEAKPIIEEPAKAETAPTPPRGPAWRETEIERAVSLADAFIIRGEGERALALLLKAQDQLGDAPEIKRRLGMLSEDTPSPETADSRAQKRQKLKALLRRINDRRLSEG